MKKGQLLETKQISKMIASFIGENKVFERMYLSGDLSLYSVYQQLTLRTCGRRGFAESVFPLKFDLRYHHHDYHHYDHHTIQMT